MPNLVFAVVLVAAQAVISAHTFDHEIGTTQKPVCAMCVAAGQLGAATVDTGAIHAVADSAHTRIDMFVRQLDSIHTLTVRQRGPPTSL